MTRIISKVLALIGLLIVLICATIQMPSRTTAQEPADDFFLYLPVIVKNCCWDPVEGEEFYIDQRSGSQCAEHDNYVVPLATAVEREIIPPGTEVTAEYKIRAGHPTKEEHPFDFPSDQWCNSDWTHCPNNQPDAICNISTPLFLQGADPFTKVFDNVKEQIYVLDGPADIGTFEVVVNGQSYGQHTGVIFGSQWGTENSFPFDGVIYANGFSRWKPKGEEPGKEKDPCFGSSIVLGPFQIDLPFLSDGFSPNPLRHPNIDVINITVGNGWKAQMSGVVVESGQTLMNVSWSLERLNISSSEMLISILQHATVTQDIFLYNIYGQPGIGQVGVSSMFVDPQKHDTDTQLGPNQQLWVGDISNSSEGLWGQEGWLNRLPEEEALCLDTTTPTTHNTGSPTLCIIWISGEVR